MWEKNKQQSFCRKKLNTIFALIRVNLISASWVSVCQWTFVYAFWNPRRRHAYANLWVQIPLFFSLSLSLIGEYIFPICFSFLMLTSSHLFSLLQMRFVFNQQHTVKHSWVYSNVNWQIKWTWQWHEHSILVNSLKMIMCSNFITGMKWVAKNKTKKTWTISGIFW